MANNRTLPTSDSSFNPFIHGTTSAIFTLLPKTNFEFIGPVKMLRDYKLAPLSGEITYLHNPSINMESVCFGRLHLENPTDINSKCNGYALNKIVGNYMNKIIKTLEDVLLFETFFNQELGIAKNTHFSTISRLTVAAARLKQLGSTLINDLNDIIPKIKTNIQFFYIFPLLHKHIAFDYAHYHSLTRKEQFDIRDAIRTHLTFNHFIKQIEENHLNMEEIYQNPTPENLQKVIKLFELPKKSIVKSSPHAYGSNPEDREVELITTNIISLASMIKPSRPVEKYNQLKRDAEHHFYQLAGANWDLNAWLANNCDDYASSPEFLIKMGEHSLNYIHHLKNATQLLEDILQNNPEESLIALEDLMQFVLPPFPVLLICENSNKFKLFSRSYQEYRSNSPLKLGTDITAIATDTRDHQITIIKFLRKHGFEQVRVMLLSELYYCQNEEYSQPLALGQLASQSISLAESLKKLATESQLGKRFLSAFSLFKPPTELPTQNIELENSSQNTYK